MSKQMDAEEKKELFGGVLATQVAAVQNVAITGGLFDRLPHFLRLDGVSSGQLYIHAVESEWPFLTVEYVVTLKDRRYEHCISYAYLCSDSTTGADVFLDYSLAMSDYVVKQHIRLGIVADVSLHDTSPLHQQLSASLNKKDHNLLKKFVLSGNAWAELSKH